MAKRWKYSGDVNLENGGYYWRQDAPTDDFVSIVDVIPCADAGGPGNLYVIESGSLYLPFNEPEKFASALDCCGWTCDARGDLVGNGQVSPIRKGSASWLWYVVEAFKVYHGVDQDAWNGSHVVQIGPDEGPFVRSGWSPNPDVILRSNARLSNYVRREFL